MLADVGGGVDTAGDSFRPFPINLSASWNGSIDDGCAMFSSLFGGGTGAFLKLGSLGLGFGAEKNPESDLASFTAGAAGLTSFLTRGFKDDGVPTATFLGGGWPLICTGGSLGFRFFDFGSDRDYDINKIIIFKQRSDMTHLRPYYYHCSLTLLLLYSQRSFAAIVVPRLKPYP